MKHSLSFLNLWKVSFLIFSLINFEVSNKILRKVQDKIQISLVVYEGYYKVGKSVLHVIPTWLD
jgi:hypothetical protein